MGQVLAALREEVGLPAIRGSYSEIGAQGVLRSHYGMTNGQVSPSPSLSLSLSLSL